MDPDFLNGSSILPEDDRNSRSVFLNGFSSGSLLEAELSDYFSVLFDGHVRSVWIDRRSGTHALVEFDDEKWVKRAIEVKKHWIGHDRSVILAWKCNKGKFSKRDRKRKRANSEESTSTNFTMTTTSESSGNSSIGFNFTIDGDFSNFARMIYNSLRVTEEEQSQREMVSENLEKGILEIGIWPKKTKLILLGSSVNGFGWKNSDIDFTLLVMGNNSEDDQKGLNMEEFDKLDQKERLEILASCLREIEGGMVSNVVQIHGRRCPLVQFTYSTGSMSYRCEMSVDNEHAVQNTHWLGWVSSRWKWIPVLYTIFRWWLIKWDAMGKPNKGATSMKGYALALLVVAYCQSRNWIRCDYYGESKNGTEQNLDNNNESNNTVTFDMFNDLVCFIGTTRLKQTVFTPALHSTHIPILPVTKFLRSDKFEEKFKFSWLNIQDPFDLTHNTAGNVIEGNVNRLKSATRRWSNVNRSGMENAWKKLMDFSVRRKLDFEIDANNDEEPSFVCEPTVDALRRIAGMGNGRNEGEMWCQLGLNAILTVFSDVLKLKVAEEIGQNERSMEKRYHCLAWTATWIWEKRKDALEKLVNGNERFEIGVRSRYEIEQRISEILIEDENRRGKKKTKRIEPVAEFGLLVEIKCEEEYQEVAGRLTGEKHVGILNKFLADFMNLVIDDAIRKVERYGTGKLESNI